ncbi:hypothetical protein ABIQ69_00985 [Agromyces sp. G08B096]|uniref:Uncharacterized protein n=1 Tax=Agromyces sp. G08B096 TaxID=3156399 RepID=A0AAU7W8J3_9MICO
MNPTTPLRPHPVEGWTERHRHPDGVSYWRRGERHRARGWAVERLSVREAWLFGRRIPSPEHDPTVPLVFDGQDAAGCLRWLDADGRVRAEQWVTSGGVEETRLLDGRGRPERHACGGYQRLRVLGTGERRHYEESATGPRLHRVDGPAIEDASQPERSRWFEHGVEAASPAEVLERLELRSRAEASGRLARRRGGPARLEEPWMAAGDHRRVAAFVRRWPESELSWRLALAWPDVWHD